MDEILKKVSRSEIPLSHSSRRNARIHRNSHKISLHGNPYNYQIKAQKTNSKSSHVSQKVFTHLLSWVCFCFTSRKQLLSTTVNPFPVVQIFFLFPHTFLIWDIKAKSKPRLQGEQANMANKAFKTFTLRDRGSVSLSAIFPSWDLSWATLSPRLLFHHDLAAHAPDRRKRSFQFFYAAIRSCDLLPRGSETEGANPPSA